MDFTLFENPQSVAGSRDYPFRAILSHAATREARAVMEMIYGDAATPLRDLRLSAEAAKVGRILYKDESNRCGLDSFKALGAPYALSRILIDMAQEDLGRPISAGELLEGRYESRGRSVTVACATDGNHGKALASAARKFGVSCVVFLHRDVSAGRETAIKEFGASTIRVPGDYDLSVRIAAEEARSNGWQIVSDTSWSGYERVPTDVMQGYSIMFMEVIEALRAEGARLPTHVFVQGGVGGIAAAACAYLWEEMGLAAPVFTVVEPEQADCLLQSARTGHATRGSGNLQTVMAGLSCGEASPVAWRILAEGARFFMTIPDRMAIHAMRLLARGEASGSPIVAGESATAGLAAFLAVAGEERSRREMDLGTDAVVLVIGTEGATDPHIYRKLVGTLPFPTESVV